ncbi:MAG: general secretion pathway protein GspB [Desulfobacterales bacterium]|nr:general secretion pathway protein GspB [Desulfobacterales bacterium]
MSSILRAMKKAEQAVAAGQPSGTEAGPVPASAAQAPRARLAPRQTAIAAGILVIAVALWGGIYFSRPAQKPDAPLAVGAPGQAAPKRVASGLPSGPAQGAGRPKASRVANDKTPAQPVQAPPAISNPAQGAPQAPADEGRPAGVPEPGAAPVLGDQADPPADAHVSAGPPAPPAKRPELTLEGIVWSDDPKARIAVINGKMVREGETIQGVRIQSIGENNVAVSAADDRWTVRF